MNAALPFPACDLREHPPRSARAMLGGLYFLPRTIDKMRAKIQGTLGLYKIGPGISMYLFEWLGITEADFEAIVRSGASDDEIVAWLHERTDRSKYDWINDQLVNRGIRDEEHRQTMLPNYPVLAERPELRNWFEIFELDDAWIFDPARR
jgi:hypothetical protein